MTHYIVSAHAIDRAVDRLGIAREGAANHLKQLMENAVYIGTQTNTNGRASRQFYHEKKNVIIVVDETLDKIITVYHADSEVIVSQTKMKPIIPEAFADDIRQLVQRKFKAKERDFKRKHRALEIELAEINLELAQLTLNQLKAKSPKARNSIAERINEVKTKADRIQYEIDSAVKSFEEMMKEVAAVCTK